VGAHEGDGHAGREAAPGPPGLLAWQAGLLCYAAGVWSLAHQEPALWTAVALALGLLAFRRPGLPRALALSALCAGCFAAGQWHGRAVLPPSAVLPPALCAGEKARVRARVDEVVDKPFGRIEILLADASAVILPKPPRRPAEAADGDSAVAPQSALAQSPPIAVPGRIAWDWDAPAVRPAPGQSVEVELRLRPVHGFANAGGGDFEWRERLRGVSMRGYTRGPDVEATFSGWGGSRMWRWREALRGRLLRLTPDTQGGAIVLGLLLGDRSKIGIEATEELRAAGLSHTLALSGLNVVYVAALGLGAAWMLGLGFPRLYLRVPRRKLAVLLSFPLVAAYVWLGQASPSLVRSAWMFGFWGLLLLLDRGRVLLDGLLLALLCILLLDPLALFDVGLQMSVAAVAGMALLYPWIAALIPRPRRGVVLRAMHWAWDALAVTLASNIALLPVSIWYFGSFPPNFLLNLPWLPAQGFAVQIPAMAGLALAAVPGLDIPAGWLLSAAAHVQDAMLVGLHRAMATGWFPTWALLRPLWPEILGATAAIAAAPYCLGRGRGADTARCLLLAGLLLMAWPQAQTLLDDASDEVRLTVLDVGQSQALLVRAPGGRRVLVDAGGSFSPTFDMGRSVVGPALTWGRPPTLDAALFSHPDLDHAQGLAWILRRFRVGEFCTNGDWPEGPLGAELTASLAAGVNAGRLAPRPLRAGDALDLGGGVRLEVLHPAEGYEGRGTNDRSLVLLLSWRGEGLALLPGDVGRDGIEDMLERGARPRAQALVLPHHGSKSALSGMLYEAVSPRVALASCGFLNMYHFPNKDVAAELARLGIALAATPEQGMLELVWTRPEGPFTFLRERR
jgi:competence protein ComEC